MKYLALKLPNGSNSIEVGTPPNIPSGVDAPSNIVQATMGLLIAVGIAAALIFMLYGGFLWITSQGDKQKLDRARSAITYSIIGIIVIVLAFVIVQVIGTVLGISSLSIIGEK